jgi:hypothetical protein
MKLRFLELNQILKIVREKEVSVYIQQNKTNTSNSLVTYLGVSLSIMICNVNRRVGHRVSAQHTHRRIIQRLRRRMSVNETT